MIKPPISLNKAREDLVKAKEEARQTLHMLSSEARQKWKGFGSKVGELEENLNHRGERATEVSAAKVHELAQSVRQFVERQLGRS